MGFLAKGITRLSKSLPTFRHSLENKRKSHDINYSGYLSTTSALYWVHLNLRRLYHTVTAMSRIYPYYGSSRQFYKHVPLYQIGRKVMARDVAESFLKEVWKLDGLPSEIISDLYAMFAVEFWESWCKNLGITQKGIDWKPPSNWVTNRMS